MRLYLKYGIFLFASVLSIGFANTVEADETTNNNATAQSGQANEDSRKSSITIGNQTNKHGKLVASDSGSDTQPSITKVSVSGDVDSFASGSAFFKDIVIELEGKNLTDDHFLTEEGLHWSDKTYSELI